MYFTHKNMKLHYEIIGTGKTIFLLHGLYCDMNLMLGCMEPVFKECKGYKRIYIDLPGMGKSDAASEFAASDKILEVLTAFIQSTGETDFLLAGESYGGYLARGILSELFDSIAGIMLLCPVAVAAHERRSLPKVNIKLDDGDFLNQLEKTERDNFCENVFIANKYTYDRYRKEIQPGLEAADQEFISRLGQKYTFSFDVDEKIHRLRFEKPALFLAGRQDTRVGYQDLWNIMEDYTRATFSVLDAAGHNLQFEQPELFVSLVKDWLHRVDQNQTHNRGE